MSYTRLLFFACQSFLILLISLLLTSQAFSMRKGPRFAATEGVARAGNRTPLPPGAADLLATVRRSTPDAGADVASGLKKTMLQERRRAEAAAAQLRKEATGTAAEAKAAAADAARALEEAKTIVPPLHFESHKRGSAALGGIDYRHVKNSDKRQRWLNTVLEPASRLEGHVISLARTARRVMGSEDRVVEALKRNGKGTFETSFKVRVQGHTPKGMDRKADVIAMTAKTLHFDPMITEAQVLAKLLSKKKHRGGIFHGESVPIIGNKAVRERAVGRTARLIHEGNAYMAVIASEAHAKAVTRATRGSRRSAVATGSAGGGGVKAMSEEGLAAFSERYGLPEVPTHEFR